MFRDWHLSNGNGNGKGNGSKSQRSKSIFGQLRSKDTKQLQRLTISKSFMVLVVPFALGSLYDA